MNLNLSDVIEGLVEERGLNREKIVSIVCEGMLAAYRKRFPLVHFFVEFNKKSGAIEIFSEKKVVSSVIDEEQEISLRKAKSIDPIAELDGTVRVPFEEKIGRIEILTAKQVIAGKIRDLEQFAVYNDFKEKEGSIVTGVIHKRERSGWVVKLGEVMALLPKENTIPREIIKIGYPLKALLKEVSSVARGDYQLFLDRASGDFVRKLIEVEIPEVFEGLVEIKKIVRFPGYKTKIIVASTSKEIDPVGTCVGVGGARIKPILRELGQEKIDLIEATNNVETLIRHSLKPAEVDKVEFIDDKRVVVSLAPDQRSFAIGKMGQNINLASRLVGYDIQLQDLASAQGDLRLYQDEMQGEGDDEHDERDSRD